MDGRLRNMTSLFLEREGAFLCLYRIGSRVADRRYIGSAGGHFEEMELNDARACVLREMEEEMGLKETDVENLRMRYVALRLKNGELRQNYYFFGSLKEDRPLVSTEGELRWVPFDEIPSLDMPASAREMILHYMNVGRFDSELYGAVIQKEGTRFVPLREF